MPVTLRDIADRTGVSPSVVSTVLSGRENGTFVSKDTRRRVLEIAQQLNYTPVRSGRPRGSRRLRRMRSEQFIGIWAPSSERSTIGVVSSLQHQLEEFAKTESEGDETQVLGVRLLSDVELPKLDTLGLLGVIVVGDIAMPRGAALANIPTIQLGEAEHLQRDVTSVHVDNYDASRQLASHLWQLGHRSAGFLAPALKPRVTRQRWLGMQSVWAEHNDPTAILTPTPYDNDTSLSLREQIDNALKGLYVAQGDKPAQAPTSLICFDESVTSYALQGLYKLGKSVPEDVSVVTFGDSDGIAEAMFPPVTALRFPTDTLTDAAFNEILARSADPSVAPATGFTAGTARDLKFAGKLIKRESTAQPKKS